MALDVWPIVLSGALAVRCLKEIASRLIKRRGKGKRCASCCQCCSAPDGSRRRSSAPHAPHCPPTPVDREASRIFPFLSSRTEREESLPEPATPENVTAAPSALAIGDSLPDAEERTPLADLAVSCLQAQICTDGSLTDLSMQHLLEVSSAYRQLLEMFGSAAYLVLTDFEKNRTMVQGKFDEDPQSRRTLSSFLEAELATGHHIPGPGDKCKLRDPSGACSLQWMIRSMQFFMNMLQFQIVEDRPDPAFLAYQQTLRPYHGFMASMAFKTALMGMPKRSDTLSMKVLCPSLADDPQKLESVIVRDGKRATEVMLPTLDFMVASMRQHGLWEDSTV